MAKRLPYAAWVQQKLRGQTKAQQQAIRSTYYNDYGRVSNYDAYVRDCKADNFTPDTPPEGYWEWAERGYEKPLTVITMGLGALLYLIIGVIAGSTGRKG
jgi:hypothetical protein